MPLVWSLNSRLPESQKLKDRVYGPTLMLTVLEASEGNKDESHFFLGGKQSTLDKLVERFSQNAIAGVYSPPFGSWDDEENAKMINLIRESGAKFVWVGLGCPKQEQWIATHLADLPPAVYFGVGAAFAFHTGEVRQAPALFQKAGMEWLFRLLAEPRRLWKRYAVHNTLFLIYTVKDHFLK
jgi:N-acetylglucosaminyldiphosphoundecaprenol N-acetyl-beta-D-mannosaminyltransferase